MKPKEAEKMIIQDGWILKNQEGSRRHYIHPTKKGRVTIAFTKEELNKKTTESIKRQAGLK